MIHFRILSRFALIGGLCVPALAPAQDARPAEPSASAPKVSQVVTGQDGETVTFQGSIVLDPTAAIEQAGGDTPESKVRTAIRTQAPALFRPAQSQTLSRTYSTYSANLDALTSKFGIALAPVDDVLRSQLEIARACVVVVEVKPGSLAEQAGLKPKDVILSLGGKDVTGVPQARSALLGLGKEAVEVKLIREGKPRRMSLVGPEHGFTAESSEFWIGVPVSPVDAVLRSHLSELPAEAGLIANDVVKESPADKAGVKKYDILVSLGGKPLKSPDSLIAQVQASGGKAVPLVYLRAGKPTTVEVTPTRRAHPTVISLSPGVKELHYRVLQPQMAIEVNKQIEEILDAQKLALARPAQPAKDIQIELFTDRLKTLRDDVDSKLTAQLKELTSKVDDLRKAIEAMKKP